MILGLTGQRYLSIGDNGLLKGAVSEVLLFCLVYRYSCPSSLTNNRSRRKNILTYTKIAWRAWSVAVIPRTRSLLAQLFVRERRNSLWS